MSSKKSEILGSYSDLNRPKARGWVSSLLCNAPVPILILRWMGAPDVVGIVAAGAVLLALCPPALYAVAAAFKGFDVAADQPT